jgi:hypothetical protein
MATKYHVRGGQDADGMRLRELSVSVRLGDGTVTERPLCQVTSGQVVSGAPWRTARSARGQVHYPGFYWSATTGGHVIYESRLELARLLLARVYQVTDKGPLERWFRTLGEQLLAALPGYKGPDVYRRGKDPEQEAFATVRAAGGELHGYDTASMSTYVRLSRGMLGSVNLSGRTDLALRVKSGQVAGR